MKLLNPGEVMFTRWQTSRVPDSQPYQLLEALGKSSSWCASPFRQNGQGQTWTGLEHNWLDWGHAPSRPCRIQHIFCDRHLLPKEGLPILCQRLWQTLAEAHAVLLGAPL